MFLAVLRSGMFIPDPGSLFLSIPDLESGIPYPNNNKRGGGGFGVLPTDKKLGQLAKNYSTFYPKNS